MHITSWLPAAKSAHLLSASAEDTNAFTAIFVSLQQTAPTTVTNV